MKNELQDIFVVINTEFGGFSLNDEEMELWLTESGISYQVSDEKQNWSMNTSFHDEDGKFLSRYDIPRDDEVLVRLVHDNPKMFTELQIVKVPGEFRENWYIHEYDGLETVYRADYMIGEYL